MTSTKLNIEKTYYWHIKQQMWTLHNAQECRLEEKALSRIQGGQHVLRSTLWFAWMRGIFAGGLAY